MPARALFAIPLIRRHTFDDADNRRLAHVCGPLDAHLRQIESALGVSLRERYEVNSIAVPRKAKDAVGGITRLVRLTWVHRISAAVFVVLGLLVLFGGEAPEMHHKPQEPALQMEPPTEPASATSTTSSAS
jgi:hypothetical protein